MKKKKKLTQKKPPKFAISIKSKVKNGSPNYEYRQG
jgi:hypothetical protein